MIELARATRAMLRPLPTPQPSQLAMSVRWATAIIGRDFMLQAARAPTPQSIIFGRQ